MWRGALVAALALTSPSFADERPKLDLSQADRPLLDLSSTGGAGARLRDASPRPATLSQNAAQARPALDLTETDRVKPEKPKLRVSGVMVAGIGYDSSTEGVRLHRDGEITFDWRGRVAEGVRVRGHVEMEAFSAFDLIDEAYVQIITPYGSLKIGEDDTAKAAYHNGVVYSYSSWVGYYDTTPAVQFDAMAGIDGSGDPAGIYYDSPNWNGFQFGLSYQPDSLGEGIFYQGDPDFVDHQIGIGAVYERYGKESGWGVSAGWTDTTKLIPAWHVGGNAYLDGFTVAATYEDDGTPEVAVGAEWINGPLVLGGGYAFDDVGLDGNQVIGGWVTYHLAPGVAATAGVEHHDDFLKRTDLGGVASLTILY